MPLLKVSNLDAYYGDFQVLFDISIEVRKEELVSIVGANAAGKSTLLRSISGLLKRMSGSVVFNGEELKGHPPYEIVGLGITHILEGRRVFPLLSVQENLEVGAYSRRSHVEPPGKIHDIARGLIRKVPRLNRFFLWIDDLLGYGRPPKEKNFWQVL